MARGPAEDRALVVRQAQRGEPVVATRKQGWRAIDMHVRLRRKRPHLPRIASAGLPSMQVLLFRIPELAVAYAQVLPRPPTEHAAQAPGH